MMFGRKIIEVCYSRHFNLNRIKQGRYVCPCQKGILNKPTVINYKLSPVSERGFTLQIVLEVQMSKSRRGKKERNRQENPNLMTINAFASERENPNPLSENTGIDLETKKKRKKNLKLTREALIIEIPQQTLNTELKIIGFREREKSDSNQIKSCFVLFLYFDLSSIFAGAKQCYQPN